MQTKLSDFINTRRAEIKALLIDLKAELKALDVAEWAIQGIPSQSPERKSRQRPDTAGPTIKAMVAGVLYKLPEGADANTINNLINITFNGDISRSSLSPQLSRMKKDGELILNEMTGVWKLTEVGAKRHVSNDEPDWDLMAEDQRMEQSLADGPQE